MTDDEVRRLRAGGVGMSVIERLADEALRRGRVIVEAQALHRQAVADLAKYEEALRNILTLTEEPGVTAYTMGRIETMQAEACAALEEEKA